LIQSAVNVYIAGYQINAYIINISVTTFKQSKSSYPTFIHNFVRELCLPLKDGDVKKISTTLNTLANEKIRAAREKDKPQRKKGKLFDACFISFLPDISHFVH